MLLGSLLSLDLSDHFRYHLEQITGDAIVGNLEDGRGLVFVDGDDALGILHTGLVLDGAGDAQGDIDLGVDGFTGLAHLVIGTQPTGVDNGAGRADHAAQLPGQLRGKGKALPRR